MISNVIKITKDNENIQKVLDEARKTSAYAELDPKQTLRVRLLAEELCGMFKELTEDFEGTFHIENEGLSFSLITRIKTEEMNKKLKKDFIKVSLDKRNSAAKGVMGKVRDVVENMLYPEDPYYSSKFITYQLETAALMNDTWTLSSYKKAKKEEEWDELEKSIVANLADDVTVSVKGKNVEIIITKSF